MSEKEITVENESEMSGVTSGPLSVHPKELSPEQLKRNRGAAKGVLTKKRNEIESCIDKLESAESAENKIFELKVALEGLRQAHAAYHETLKDEEDIQDSSDYLQLEETRAEDLTNRIKVLQSSFVNEQEKQHTVHNHVEPSDSVSNAGTKRSSSSSVAGAKAKALARKARLLAEAKALKKLQELEQEELKLHQARQEWEIKKEIAMAEAEEQALSETEGNPRLPDVKPADSLHSRIDSWIQKSEERMKEPLAIAQSDKPVQIKPDPADTEDQHRESQLRPVHDQPHPMAYMRHMETLLAQQQQHTLTLMLPQPELPVFGGDPLEYCSFIRAFESIIESRTNSSSARLYYLIQYTSGDVNELMRSCLTMKAEEGYQEALRLLKQRYGQDYKIASAYVDRVTTGPVIKAERAEDLRKFSILITSCKNALKDIGYLGRVNNPDCLKKIIARLPFDMKRKWRDIADDISERQCREITIEDVASFIEKRARSASHPVFGDIFTPKPIQGQERFHRQASHSAGSPGKRSSFAITGESKKSTESASSRLQCPLCRGAHWLSQCSDFRSKSLEERMKITKNKGLCNNCLTSGHIAKQCPKSSFCRIDGCQSKHSTFLHPVSDKGNSRNESQERGKKSEGNERASGQSGYIKVRETRVPQKTATSLAIVPVKVKATGGNQVVETYAFLDSGSNTTFCTKDLMERLQANGKNTTLSLTTLGIEDNETKTSVFSLQVSDLKEHNLIELPFVFSTQRLPVTTDNRASNEEVCKWEHLRGIDIIDIDSDVGLLIGSDVPRALEPKEVRSGQPGDPYATRTDLGWVINGPLKRMASSHRTTNFIKADADLSAKFEKYCNMEFNDSSYDGKSAMSQEDKRALEKMKSSIHLNDGHYVIGLPWKEGCPDLPDNRSMAECRLQYLKKKLGREPVLLSKYSAFMGDLLQKGFARLVPDDQKDSLTKWYLPHHPVSHPRKPEKTRVVFDCSAKYRGTSLNSQLSQGPDLTNSLVGVLIRFRKSPVALMADIEGMFLQVRVSDEDANALRFLWWPDGQLSSDPKEYQMLVHLFGGASSPSCANFALRRTAEDNSDNFDPATVETVKRNFYVDDCLKSVESDHQAIRLQEELRQLLSRGGFRLTKWMSNSIKVLESIPESERASAVKDLVFDKSTLERALGVRWNVSSDKFGFSISVKDKQPTRRGILSTISSIYDPLGFAAPFILPAKGILQNLCRRGLGWDEEIPEQELKQWQDWLSDLPKLEGYTLDRCIKPSGFGDIVTAELHHFSDASLIGYGAVSYIRIKNAKEEVHCCLMMAKSRLTPIKPVTIPRLELSAAVVATRLDTMLRREMDIQIDRSVFWTDSTCVIRYVENDGKRFQTFVANRIAAIREVSVPSQWRYVDTKSNPADEASRGLNADELVGSKRWQKAPAFLWGSEEDWPRRPDSMEDVPDDPEIKRTAKSFATGSIVEVKEDTIINEILQRFSSWSKLRKTVAWLLRYKAKLKSAWAKRQHGEEIKFGEIRPIDVEELQNSEKEILKLVQGQSFPAEMAAFSLRPQREKEGAKGLKNPIARNSPLQQLDPFLSDDGLLRVGGRLGRAPISDEARHQVILPKRHHVVELISRYYHQACGHSGLEYVLALIRRRYWIIKARPTLRRILNTCFSCRRRQARPEEQKMAHLPKDRVTPSKPPFSLVGVDCFGPFQVRRGRTMVKRYGVLFTCLSVRAVHIEIAHSLDTPSFINALRRFIARRGCPEEIRSDNGGNFVSGNKELSEAIEGWNKDKIQDFLLQQSIKWVFNPPAGSHHGGVWERCIRTARKIMNAICKEQTLDDESLPTLMCEVEAIINGRPITKVSDDPNDCEALSPNHLLLLRAGPTLPPGLFNKEDCYSRRRWRQVQYLADVFWRRWIKEYLPSLQQRQRWNKSRRNLQVNDIVLVVDENSPRSLWPLGRIQEVRKSCHDEHVRAVKVKTRSSLLERPIDKIVLLEGADFTKDQDN